jgi:putative Flp pilus-assembly TadE/G-like protein
LIKVHNRKRRERGQTLVFVLLAMPLFLALIALVIDGSMLLVKKRALQNAADAAALAVVQSAPDPTCTSGCLTSFATDYSQKNGGPDLHPCSDADPTKPTDSDCYRYPYIDKDGNVYDGHAPEFPPEAEVRMTASSPTIFASAIGLGSAFKVSARSVAQNSPRLGATTVTGETVTGEIHTNTIFGETHTTTDPGIPVGGSGVAFTMSRSCTSITYTGAGTKGNDVLGAFATNGGLDFGGNGNRKKVTSLGYDKPRCVNNPTSPPSGTPQCTATAWGNGPDVDLLCVKTLIDLNPIGMPINWPIPPPTVPTPQTGAWNPSWYPSKCSDVTSLKGGNNVVTVNLSNAAQWPEGIYCVTGGTSFQIQGVDPAASRGHTFFALGGGTIGVSSNSSSLKYYWPASCGPRPLPTDPRKGCVSGYDPYTLLYATYASADGNCAICLTGGGNTLFGDNFAIKPDIFPPSLTDTGALVQIGGGALTAGTGMFESWVLRIGGNTGTYNGTGFPLEIPGATHTTTDPDQTETVVLPGHTNPGTTIATTIGTDIDLSQ